MNIRENVMAILRYQPYDSLPVLHFGYWKETLDKWVAEGHLTKEQADGNCWYNRYDREISALLGFDGNWGECISGATALNPYFPPECVKEFSDGTCHVRNGNGVVVVQKPGVVSIPMEIAHTLTDRASWEEHYKWRYAYSDDRVNIASMKAVYDEYKQIDRPIGIHCGSLFGHIRDVMGVEGISYLYADDEDLYAEIINTIGDLCYRVTERALKLSKETGMTFDYGHFWEDICYKNGPLVTPSVFDELVGPHYKKITTLLAGYGIDIVSLDCDGWIDALIPTWFENGVNTMFPIEVGTWEANIAPWREKYGKELRGVGGMDKRVFAADYAAVDREIERLRSLVELGGYIPCPDHRIAPDAKWENVQYYCDRMHKVFG